ncbi:MAG: hypothetical protein HYV08_00255 [Deltaproteobacteria bacterium]|nr:hypothetical protein [Deltaproteobacteria bacterium]MBI3079082.1 hypothetical protein [Deltaproteobacteria bacterium]
MKRIGLITPYTSEATIAEFYRMIPEGAELVVRSFGVDRLQAEEFAAAFRRIEQALDDLERAGVDYLVVTGELVLCSRGPEGNRQVLEDARKRSPLGATTVLTAVVEGLQSLGVSRAAMASPFTEAHDETVVRFLGASGITILAQRCVGLNSNPEIAQLEPETGYAQAEAALRAAPAAQGLYMPCANWRVTPVIPRIEATFGVPVVANLQAWIWAAARALGVSPRPGCGRLLDTLLE